MKPRSDAEALAYWAAVGVEFDANVPPASAVRLLRALQQGLLFWDSIWATFPTLPPLNAAQTDALAEATEAELKQTREALGRQADQGAAALWENCQALTERGLHRLDEAAPVEALLAFEAVGIWLEQPPLVARRESDVVRADLYINRGSVLGRLGQLAAALEAYDQAQALYEGPLAGWQELDDVRAFLHMNRGNALDKLGQPAAALEAYDQALEFYDSTALAGQRDLDAERAHLHGRRGLAWPDENNSMPPPLLDPVFVPFC